MVAQELAISHPERVDGLVLACTAPGWPFTYPMPVASIHPELGHLLFWEDPDGFADEVASFLLTRPQPAATAPVPSLST